MFCFGSLSNQFDPIPEAIVELSIKTHGKLYQIVMKLLT